MSDDYYTLVGIVGVIVYAISLLAAIRLERSTADRSKKAIFMSGLHVIESLERKLNEAEDNKLRAIGLFDSLERSILDLSHPNCRELLARLGESEERLRQTKAELEGMTEHRDDLRRELAECEQDAARYRWLRGASSPERGKFYLATDSRDAFIPIEIDAAIDDAMREGKL